MKSREQKQLELLYEQVTSKDSFALLPEEDRYFDSVVKFYLIRLESNPRIKEFLRSKNINSGVLSNMLNGYERPASFSYFCNDSLGTKERAINSFYNINVLGTTESFIILRKANRALTLDFEMMPANGLNIPLTDTEIVKEKLKKSLIHALKHFALPIRSLRLEDEEVWLKWRAERLKVKELESRLPEIEGIF
jgi:hypothetical protein